MGDDPDEDDDEFMDIDDMVDNILDYVYENDES